jgi:hypothetical protein
MKQLIKILCIVLVISGISSFNTNIFAQNPVCVYCGTQLPNGVHASTCRYYVPPSASSGTSSTDIKTMVAGAIIQNVLTNLLNNNSVSNQKELEEKQRQAAIDAELAAKQAAEQKILDDLKAQAEHDKMMGSYKTLDGSKDLQIKPLGNSNLGFKPLDEPKFQAVNFNCKITSVSGYVEILKANSKKTQVLDGQQSIVLEKGDVITTGATGRIKIHFDFESGGRDIIVGKFSQLSVEVDKDGSQYPFMKQGQLHFSKGIVEDAINELSRTEIGQKIKKKIQVRTPSAVTSVRGTTFTLSEDSLKGTELIVLEGSVEFTGLKTGKSVLVEIGLKGIIKPNGEISEPIRIEISNIEKWWEN